MSYQPWAAVVALKPATVGKSRMAALPAPLRRRLAAQMALDALVALASATSRLVVVSDSTTVRRRLQLAGIMAEVIADPQPGGLNNALRAGEAVLRAEGFQRVLACVGDLPTLTEDAVRAVVTTMANSSTGQRGRGFVADHDGTGSTMLLADDVPLNPHFGADSAAAHRSSGAIELTAPAASAAKHGDAAGPAPRGRDLTRARADVDAPEDLPRAIGIGVGRHTGTLITNGRLADYASLTVTEAAANPGQIHASSESGQEFVFGATELDAAAGVPRIGDRLHAAVGDRVISAWLD